MCCRNNEGYADLTATEAIGRVSREEKQRFKKMCNSCRHRLHCGTAFRKQVWCGNHMESEGNRI